MNSDKLEFATLGGTLIEQLDAITCALMDNFETYYVDGIKMVRLKKYASEDRMYCLLSIAREMVEEHPFLIERDNLMKQWIEEHGHA